MSLLTQCLLSYKTIRFELLESIFGKIGAA